MLPQIRQEEGLYPVPQFKIEKTDIEDFTEELKLDNQVFLDRSARGAENFVHTQFFDVPEAGLIIIEKELAINQYDRIRRTETVRMRA